MATIARKFWELEGPTWIVAAAVYGAWFLLIWFHAEIPWWLMMPLGAYVIAWHFSLQHETIHGFRGVPGWFRFAIAFPPLGLWFPYPLYRKSHSIHHRNSYLTEPGVDTESYYVRQAEWASASRLTKAVLLVNQTLAGRLLIGPLLRLWKLATREVARVRDGDYSHLPHWGIHVVAVGILFWFVSGIAGMAWWEYVLLMAYPGMSLGLLRAFIEHRAAPHSDERTASIESNVLFGLLFLYNNIHIVHHLKPAMPWYDIPAYYRENRDRILERNGQFVFRGYAEIARQYLFRPVFHPAHPTL